MTPDQHFDPHLDSQLGRLATPVMPADLIARIVREVPRLPQIPHDRVIPAPAAPRWSRRLALGGGIAALAAGVAVVALIGSPNGAGEAPRGSAVAPQLALRASDQPASTPVVAPVAAPVPTQLAQRTAARAVPAAAAQPATAPSQMSLAPPAATPAAPEELAAVPKPLVVVPVGPEPDDGDDIDVGVPAAGVMGPPVPQGMGYANGALGSSMPMDAATAMPGGMAAPSRRGPPPR